MSNMPGMGVMIGMLGGNSDSVAAIKGSLNKKITALSLTDDALRMTFEDGTTLKLRDDGQSCCESRYMRTDDKLDDYVGATFVNVELAPAPAPPKTSEYEEEEHEVQFLRVTTDKGVFVMSNHNEHNGYYGGFWIVGSLE